ncbi:MAG: DUF6600 domain-containing protein [Terracidiphilus sp.]|jgi:hypothetical protein
MYLLALASARRLLAAIAVAAFLALASTPLNAQDDPPAQAGRLSYISGAVSIQQVGSDDWGQALPNLPLGPGDRVVTDSDGRAEIQVGQTFIRIGSNSDVSLGEDTQYRLALGVAQGSIHIRCLALWPEQMLHVNTPSGSLGLSKSGEFRVDVLPDQGAAIFTNYSIGALVSGAGGFSQYIESGQALELVGSNPVVPQWLQPAQFDALDQWSHARDQQIANAASYRYVSPEIPGASELDAAGTWQPGTDYGAVWFPNNVPAGWAPYHYGHWVNHAPWGWVWVEDEPWGYAPFHYGRWVSYEGRWGWVPGPPASHPVWAPALVVFAGGIHVGGAGVSAWFPLGPGEPYRPWYHTSPGYIDQINITNIGESRRVHVQTTYVNINVVNVTYVNRSIGVTAMRHEDFAAGRSAHGAAVVVDVHLFDHVQVLERPEAQPSPHPFAGHPPLRPVRVSTERPALINESGKLVSSKPGAKPFEPPVRPAPQVKALPGRAVVAPPPRAKAPVGMHPAPPVPPAKPAPVEPPAPKPMERGVKPPAPVSPAPAAKPVVEPPAKPAPPASAKPAAEPAKPTAPAGAKPQEKKTDKDKKDEKKPQS